jgi:hypothetical protein
VDEYIKSFEKPQGPTDPEVLHAGELLKSAQEKEAEGDMPGARSDLDEAIDALRSTTDAKKLLSAGYFARGRHWAKRDKVGTVLFPGLAAVQLKRHRSQRALGCTRCSGLG